jgi:ATP-dependent DNA helicase RecQ
MKGGMTREEITHATGLSARKLVGLLHKLEEAGAARILEDHMIEAASDRPLPEIVEAAEKHQRFLRELRKRRLQQMQLYAESRTCRRACLLRYFGDFTSAECHNCDRCEERGYFSRAA